MAAPERPGVELRRQQLPARQGPAGVRHPLLEPGHGPPGGRSAPRLHPHRAGELVRASRCARGARPARSTSSGSTSTRTSWRDSRSHRARGRARTSGAPLFGGRRRFVLSKSGHIQALVNPPSPDSRSSFRVADELPETPEEFVAQAPEAAGQLVAGLGRVAGRALGSDSSLRRRRSATPRTTREARRPGPMSSPTEASSGDRAELPPLPTDRWWGDHLRETRWPLELSRLLVDPVFRGHDVPRGDGRPVILMPGFGGGDQTLLVLAAWLRRIGYRPHTVRVRRQHRLLGPRGRARRTPPGGDARPARPTGRADRPQPRRALRPRARPSPPGAGLPCRLDRSGSPTSDGQPRRP